jgi:hypothetical protein
MRYIKVVGSDNNDGYFRVRGQSGGTLTLEVANWVAAGGTNTGNNLLTDETHNSGALKVYYTTRASSTHGVLSFADGSTNYNADGTSALDMVDRVWRGRKLYGQINSSKTFSTSLQQKEPISLGYIDSLYAHSSGNKVVYIYMAACRLTKPVRTTTETIFYVDDARDLSVGDSLRFFDEVNVGDIEVIVIPPIESVNYGRGVGYDIIEHEPPKEIGEISATKIRSEQNEN